jgi:chloramphenicol-sensitive protein RarD
MDRKEYIQGMIIGVSAYLIWGLLPLYWKLVGQISPIQIFSHRVVWSFLFISIIMIVWKKGEAFRKEISSIRNWLYFLWPSIFISINWIVYIWAVNNGFVLETSLGYYMNPLMVTLFGSLYLKEKLSRLQKFGIGFASLGVLIKTITFGKLPIIALVLALSFSIYGLLKKKSRVDSLTGLAFETLIIGIPSLIYMIIVETSGKGISGNLPVSFWPLVMMSGVLTALPLLLYAEGLKKLPMTVMGFIQYLSPTIGLILGVFVFKEPFDLSSLIAFGLIWIGIGFFIYSQVLFLKETNHPEI